MQQHKSRFDKVGLRFLDQMKQDKMQWLWEPNQSNAGNLYNVRRETIRHFGNKQNEYLRAKINEFGTNSHIKNTRDLYRGISDFRESYQSRTNIVKDEKDNLITALHSILATWKNHFSQLLNVHGINDVRQTEIHATEPFVFEPSAFELEMVVEKLKKKTHIARY